MLATLALTPTFVSPVVPLGSRSNVVMQYGRRRYDQRRGGDDYNRNPPYGEGYGLATREQALSESGSFTGGQGQPMVRYDGRYYGMEGPDRFGDRGYDAMDDRYSDRRFQNRRFRERYDRMYGGARYDSRYRRRPLGVRYDSPRRRGRGGYGGGGYGGGGYGRESANFDQAMFNRGAGLGGAPAYYGEGNNYGEPYGAYGGDRRMGGRGGPMPVFDPMDDYRGGMRGDRYGRSMNGRQWIGPFFFCICLVLLGNAFSTQNLRPSDIDGSMLSRVVRLNLGSY